MGNFQQHITCSTATGIAIGGAAHCFGFDPPVCLVAAGLCSFAGMLPDIDSDTSRSFQECLYLLAGIGCILTISRLRYYGIDPDFAMFGGAMVLLLIRFGIGSWIKKITVHRGMIHSIPMAILAGEITFFLVTGTVQERILKAAALTMGYLSHLILDEVYSIDSTGAKLRVKKSFGTALKWTNPKQQGPVAIIYTSIICLGCAALTHPKVIEQADGNVEITRQSFPSNESLSTLWQRFSGNAKTDSPSQQSEVQRAAAEFLAQQIPAATAQSYAPAVANPAGLTTLSELPPVMQIGDDWNRNRPMQPARIVLP